MERYPAKDDADVLEREMMSQSKDFDETTKVAPGSEGDASSSSSNSSSPTDATSPKSTLAKEAPLDAAASPSSSSRVLLAFNDVPVKALLPALTTAKQKQKVRFDAQPITSIWPAVSDYDRRSIVVDLSKTPFALFRKDAVLMKTGTTSDPSAPLPPPAPPAEPALTPAGAVSSAPRGALLLPETPTTPVAAATAADGMGDEGIDPSSLDSPPSPRRRSEQTGSWDSDSSDSSCGHTDTETDFEQSDTDSNQHPCLAQQLVERRGSNTEGGPAFYGVWKRTSSEGYEALLLSSGVPKRAVAMAARKHPVHIIDHDGTYFRLIVRNGLSKVDNTLFIGDEPRLDVIGKQSYEVSLNWAHLSGHGTKNELALSSICREKGEEVIATRSLHNDGNSMVLTQTVRRPAEGYEVQAKHFFKRVMDKSELRNNVREPSSSVVTVVCRKKKC